METKRTIVLTPSRNALAAALFEHKHKQVKWGEAMPQSRAHKTYEARSVSAALSAVGAAISFVTRDDEEITITMDRQTLALLQHHIAHAIAPVTISSEQP